MKPMQFYLLLMRKRRTRKGVIRLLRWHRALHTRKEEYHKQVDDDYMAHVDIYCP